MPDLSFLIAIGVLLIVVGFFLVALGMMYAREESEGLEERSINQKTGQVRGGGVVLIGPVPVVFGSDKRFALIAMILAIVIMLLAVIFMK